MLSHMTWMGYLNEWDFSLICFKVAKPKPKLREENNSHNSISNSINKMFSTNHYLYAGKNFLTHPLIDTHIRSSIYVYIFLPSWLASYLVEKCGGWVSRTVLGTRLVVPMRSFSVRSCKGGIRAGNGGLDRGQTRDSWDQIKNGYIDLFKYINHTNIRDILSFK